jgi:hypothetical protein
MRKKFNKLKAKNKFVADNSICLEIENIKYLNRRRISIFLPLD